MEKELLDEIMGLRSEVRNTQDLLRDILAQLKGRHIESKVNPADPGALARALEELMEKRAREKVTAK